MPTIAISYRREDTRWIVGRIFDRLVEYYGHDSIFMDIDGVPLGFDFRDQIQNALQRSDILIAVIGPQWLAVQKETGQPRLADETDWVRIEIEAALGKKIPVIPVLIDRTPLPKPNELPEPLRAFAYRQATNVDTGVDFQTHMDRLIRSIDQLLEGQSHSTRGDAEPNSNQGERLTDNNRAPFTLLGNPKGGLAPRRKMEEISTRTPLIREMTAKFAAWVTRQANIWVQVVRSPKNFVSTIDMTSSAEFGKSVQFLSFVIFCMFILEMPIDALKFRYQVFDASTQIIRLILVVIEIVLFSSAIYLFGKAMRGKGEYRSSLIAMFYGTAFYPFALMTQYVLDVGVNQHPASDVEVTTKAVAGLIAVVVVAVYVTVKLVPLIKFIHSIGAIRALLVFLLTQVTVILYDSIVSGPMLYMLRK
jgi:hypothetical protein